MIGEYRSKLEQKRGKLNALIQQEQELLQRADELQVEIEQAEQAQAIAQQVAKETQSQLKYHIEDLITMAMESILDNPYAFELDFVTRKNKTECDIYFVRNGERVSPMEESGGGAVDIASFASRIALWSLDTTDNVLIFDEPFKFVSREYQAKVGEMIKQLSSELGIQILMVSHNENYIQQADRVFVTSMHNGCSNMEEVV